MRQSSAQSLHRMLLNHRHYHAPSAFYYFQNSNRNHQPPNQQRINGNNSNAFTFDPISRITAEVNPLCPSSTQFGYSYVDQTPSDKGTFRLSQVAYPNGQSSNFKYFSTTFDERLQEIQNLNSSSNVLSQFDHAFDSSGQMTNWLQQQNDSHLNFALGYDAASQLSSAQSGNAASVQPLLNQSYFNYDCAANRTGKQQVAGQVGTVSGSATNLDTITITVTDPALSGGQEMVSAYTVSGSDTTSSIAKNVAALITSDTNLQAAGINATPNGALMNLSSKTGNTTTYSASVTGSQTEKVNFGTQVNVENISITGSITSGDYVEITVNDPALTTNPSTVSQLVTGLSCQQVATDIATQLSALSNSNITIAATADTLSGSSSTIGTISVQTTSPNVTGFSPSVTGAKTETVVAGPSLNGTLTGAIGGTATSTDSVKLTVVDKGLTGGQVTVSASGTSLSTFAANLVSAINSSTGLQQIGVTASSSSDSLTITSCSTNATSYIPYTSNSAGTAPGTETFLLGLPTNGIGLEIGACASTLVTSLTDC